VADLDFGGPRGGTLLASCSSDLTIKLWDPSKEYKNIRTLHGHNHTISAVRFIPTGAEQLSGNLLVSASRDMTIRIWDVNSGYCVKTIHGHTGWIRNICPSLDGRYLLSTGDDKTGRLWDISTTTPKCKLTLTGHVNFNVCTSRVQVLCTRTPRGSNKARLLRCDYRSHWSSCSPIFVFRLL
jgi:platelet-activating factor acetylhydrolase IB subunit alpha